ncbi:hypothetical protein RHGRI_009610 [Rhododendron griersonianum]|uniref:Nuclear/nucleolar GTPase 2 n=1 Tax=Rhododendron griersonianum TaxID=479676 RepID=A0AAV6KFD7_9ERIC|nr:hypothetical protein RHGRI_009610 [Rhododendron griersonianum]
MAVGLLDSEVADLCLGKPPLSPLSASATITDALSALKTPSDGFVSVWKCDQYSSENSGECLCVGKVCLVDVVCYLCKPENLTSPSSAMDSPVSVLLSEVPGRVRHVEPHSSLLEAIDLILQGAQNLVVPIKSNSRKTLQKSSINPTSHCGREFCWLTQEDIIRFLLSSIGLFSSIPALSISTLGLISTNFSSVGSHSPASLAMGVVSDSLADQTAVAVLDDDGVLIGEISPFTLACCDESIAAAFMTLSAGDLMAFTCCGGPLEEIVRVVKTRLKEMNLEGMLDELISVSSGIPSTSSSSSSDDESSSRNTSLLRPGRYGRSCSYTANVMRRAEAIVCHQGSSLAAVMVQAIAHRVNYVWVVDEDRSLVGIVTFANMLRVFYEHLQVIGEDGEEKRETGERLWKAEAFAGCQQGIEIEQGRPQRRHGAAAQDVQHEAEARCQREGHKARPSVLRVALHSNSTRSPMVWYLSSNTRVVNQKELEFFREELQSRMSSNYNVILKEKKLPMSLLNDHQKQARVHLLDTEPFKDAFGPKRKRKRPKLMASDYESLVKKADGSQDAFEQKYDASMSVEGNEGDGLRDLVRHTMFEKGQSKRIWGELYKVIDSSDVVVQVSVLDARDPQGTRCYHLEKHLKEHCTHKHMILLLNKCDLVPAWATKAWLRVLSKQYPTLAFHASINKSFGKGSLLSVLRQFARLKSDKQAISVGFVGYPNVGKSSVINTLRTKNVCKVAPIPGETKVWQYITLTKRIFLIDCPGVVYQNSDSETDIVLKGVVRVTNLPDASEHIGEVLKRVKKEHLKRAYKITDWEDDNDFLVQLCKLTGKLLKGGEPDLMNAAKMVLHDWQRGKIPFFVPPPKEEDGSLKDEPNEPDVEKDNAVDKDQASAARRAIANVISSQQAKDVPVQKDLFDENELKGEISDQLPSTES